MARRAVQTLVKQFVKAGGEYRIAAVKPPDASKPLAAARARRWLDGLRGQLRVRLRPVAAEGVRAPARAAHLPRRARKCSSSRRPRAMRASAPASFPGWADFNNGDIYLRHARSRGPRLQDRARQTRPAHRSRSRRSRGVAGRARRRARVSGEAFPALANAPLNEERVCQYENSSNGDLLIDRHPTASNVLLVGAGSGHGFKHGPEVGRYASELVTGKLKKVEPRFSLASKAEQQNRAVH